MEREILVFSPAKINLHLDVKARRGDGYHGIVSLFHKVDLSDEIRICSLKERNIFRVTGNFDCSPEENLIVKAARLFNSRTGLEDSYDFRVKKIIPPGAGLGGGSGNAAAVLTALNGLRGFPLSREELFQMAETLGSDVPFFLGGPAALVTGRGEVLEPLEPLAGYEAVIAVPETGVSTGMAYGLFDREGSLRDDLDPPAVKDAYNNTNPRGWPFFNSFRDPLFSRLPVLETLERRLKDLEADYVSLSGSGSAVFGLFSSPETAKKAFESLKSGFPRVWKRKLLANWETSY